MRILDGARVVRLARQGDALELRPFRDDEELDVVGAVPERGLGHERLELDGRVELEAARQRGDPPVDRHREREPGAGRGAEERAGDVRWEEGRAEVDRAQPGALALVEARAQPPAARDGERVHALPDELAVRPNGEEGEPAGVLAEDV